MTEWDWLYTETPVVLLEAIKSFAVDINLNEKLYIIRRTVMKNGDTSTEVEKWASGEIRASTELCDIIRDVFGNPWRMVTDKPQSCRECKKPGRYCRLCRGSTLMPPNFQNSWRTPVVLDIARTIHDEEAFDDMPILADALEDAGCNSDELLRHLRGQELKIECQYGSGPFSFGPRAGTYKDIWQPRRSPHVRDCWALDLLLNPEVKP